jgi:glycosyltransferase involved in cell wall biosynthesis
MKLAILTKIPSPYQVELFDAVSMFPGVELSIIYVRSRDPDRNWGDRRLHHRALFLEDDPQRASSVIESSDLAVFSWYRHPLAADLMAQRARSNRPWCFWGERPGFRHKGLLGRTYRRWRLWSLWRDPRVSIWGIGHWAIEGYRREFGARSYFHVPYVSDLSAFFAIEQRPATQPRTILFSGSLIERKGIADLCAAFSRISDRHPGSSLLILGAGPMEHELRMTYGMQKHIQFLGFSDWDTLASTYRRADLLCAPSHYDGWGLIVAEAMAAGLPVIASTEMGSAREMVVEGKTGWLVPPSDIAALESSIDAALGETPANIATMRALCRLQARDYDVARGAAKVIAAAEGSLQQWEPSDTTPNRKS